MESEGSLPSSQELSTFETYTFKNMQACIYFITKIDYFLVLVNIASATLTFVSTLKNAFFWDAVFCHSISSQRASVATYC
jgi:hypothetical protein